MKLRRDIAVLRHILFPQRAISGRIRNRFCVSKQWQAGIYQRGIKLCRSHADPQTQHVCHDIGWRIALHEFGHAILAVDRMLGTLRHVRLGARDGHTRMDFDLGEGLPRNHKDRLAYTLGARATESVLLGSVGSGSGGTGTSRMQPKLH